MGEATAQAAAANLQVAAVTAQAAVETLPEEGAMQPAVYISISTGSRMCSKPSMAVHASKLAVQVTIVLSRLTHHACQAHRWRWRGRRWRR